MPNPIRRRRLGGGAFSPLQVPGLLLWLKADSLGLADNTAVATWTDSSGKGNNATQATGSKQPLYKVNQANGLPGLLFTAASVQCLRTPALTIGSVTYFVVMKLTGTAGMLMEQGATVNANDGFALYGANTSSIDFSRTAGAAQDGSSISAAWSVNNTNQLLSVSYDGTSAGLLAYLNGVKQTLTVDRANNAGTAAATDVVNIGARNQTSLPIQGNLYEILVYSPLLTLSQQQQIERYLRTKYALP